MAKFRNLRKKVCKCCGKVFETKHNNITCSPECKEERRKAQNKQYALLAKKSYYDTKEEEKKEETPKAPYNYNKGDIVIVKRNKRLNSEAAGFNKEEAVVLDTYPVWVLCEIKRGKYKRKEGFSYDEIELSKRVM